MLKLCRQLEIPLRPLRTPTLSTAGGRVRGSEHMGFGGLRYAVRCVGGPRRSGDGVRRPDRRGRGIVSVHGGREQGVLRGARRVSGDRRSAGRGLRRGRFDRSPRHRRASDGRPVPARRVGARRVDRAQGLSRSALFVCIPPSQCRDWNIMKEHAQPVLDAVEPGCLNHVYARQRPGTASPTPFHRRAPRSLLQQTISDQYGRGWFQASYSAGRIAKFWFHLFLVNANAMRTLLASLVSSETPIRGSIDPDSTKVHFGTRRTTIGWPRPDSICGAPSTPPCSHIQWKLPNVFLCGEAFSAHQAWMEGARPRPARRSSVLAPGRSQERRRKGGGSAWTVAWWTSASFSTCTPARWARSAPTSRRGRRGAAPSH